MPPRKTHEQFLKETKHLPINVIGRYKNAHSKLTFKCLLCGHRWSTKPYSLLQGHKCPLCTPGSNHRANNIVSDCGLWLEVDISTPAHPEAIMLIDKSEWLKLQAERLGRVLLNSGGYPTASSGRSATPIHKRLFPDHGGDIDHINGVRHDNRLVNLRCCSHAQNAQNRGVSKANTSGVVGVSWNSSLNKWVASIRVECKSIHLGSFYDLAEAASARQVAEARYFGEFRRQKDGER